MFQAALVAALCSQLTVADPSSGAAAANPQQIVRPASGFFNSGYTRFGLLLDAGAPDGVGVSLGFRPLSFIRLHAGITDNPVTKGLGARAGASILFYFPITPSLNFDVGRYFSGDLSRVATGADGTSANLTYTYANLHLGLEVGSPKHFTFFLRGGLSYLNANVNNLGVLLQSVGKNSANGLTAGPASVSGIIPSAKLGFSIFFL